MKKNIKRTIATLVAAVTMTVGLGSMSVSAQTANIVCSTGGTNGYVFYNLSTTDYNTYHGIDLYQLKAESKQIPINGGKTYLVVDSINYSACIYLASGEQNNSHTTLTSPSYNTTWYSSTVAKSAVTSASEKGYVTHNILSKYYGNITKTLTNK